MSNLYRRRSDNISNSYNLGKSSNIPFPNNYKNYLNVPNCEKLTKQCNDFLMRTQKCLDLIEKNKTKIRNIRNS